MRVAELRDALISVGRLRGAVRPADGGAAQPRHARRAAARRVAAAGRRDQRRRAGQRRVPVHRAGLPGAGDRLGGGRAAAQRGRLGAGPAVLAAKRRPAYGIAPAGARAAGRRSCPSTGSASRYAGGDGDRRCCTTSASTCRRAARSRWSARPARGKSTIASLAVRLVDPDTGAVLLDGADLRELAAAALAEHGRAGAPGAVRLRRHRARQRRPSTATASTTSASGRRCGWPRPTASSRRCPTAWTPRSASAAPRSPAASGSGSRWPGRWPGGPGCWCSTTPPAPSTRGWRRPSWPALRGGRRRRDDPGGGLPAGHDRARRPGGLCRARPGGGHRHPHRAARQHAGLRGPGHRVRRRGRPPARLVAARVGGPGGGGAGDDEATRARGPREHHRPADPLALVSAAREEGALRTLRRGVRGWVPELRRSWGRAGA